MPHGSPKDLLPRKSSAPRAGTMGGAGDEVLFGDLF